MVMTPPPPTHRPSVSGVPLAGGQGRDVALGVTGVPNVHVTHLELALQAPV
jgi:hypothetical protein